MEYDWEEPIPLPPLKYCHDQLMVWVDGVPYCREDSDEYPIVKPGLSGIDLLDEVLTYLQGHPSRLDQSQWYGRMGSRITGCLATWVTIIGGFVIEKDPRGDLSPHPYHQAKTLLGLNLVQASLLFSYENDLSDLLRIRDMIANKQTTYPG